MNLLSVSGVRHYNTALESIAQNPRLLVSHAKSQCVSLFFDVEFGVLTCLPTHLPWSLVFFKGGSPEAVWRIQILKACPQPPLPDSLCGLSLVSHQSVTQFSHPTQGPELGCWDPGDRFIWRWHKVSDALVNPGSWAMFISFGS